MSGSPIASGPIHPLATASFGLVAFTVLFVGAVLLLKWLQKRMGNGLMAGSGTGIRIITRRFLGGQNTLVIAEVGDRRYLLSSSRTGVSLIDRIPSEASTASDPSDSNPAGLHGDRNDSRFASLLSALCRSKSVPAQPDPVEPRA